MLVRELFISSCVPRRSYSQKGFSITAEDLTDAVSKYLTVASDTITGWANLGAAMAGLKTSPETRWASPLDVKSAVEKAFSEKFGAKEAAKPKAKVRHVYESMKFMALNVGGLIGTQKRAC